MVERLGKKDASGSGVAGRKREEELLGKGKRRGLKGTRTTAKTWRSEKRSGRKWFSDLLHPCRDYLTH